MTVINFDELAEGTIVTDQYAAQGVDISLAGGVSPGGPRVGVVSAATYPAITAPNVLVPSTDVQDVMADLVFDFVVPIDYVSLWAFDIDEPLSMKVYLGDTLVAAKSNTVYGDTAAERFEFGGIGGTLIFDRLVVDLVEGAPGSSAAGPEFYDTLEFHVTAPLPAAVPEAGGTLALGFAVLASWWSSRRHRS